MKRWWLYWWIEFDARVLRWLYAPMETWRVRQRVRDARQLVEEAWRT